MMRFLLIAALFLILLFLPFIVALWTAKRGKSPALSIKSDNVRDPRYFAKSFTRMMDGALAKYDGSGTIRLSRDESLVEAESLEAEKCDGIVLSRGAFKPARTRLFQKEIYALDDAEVLPASDLRAIACRRDLTIGKNTSVLRWADGEHRLYVGRGTDLGMSATSAKKCIVEADCRFRRLYAPEVYIGSDTSARLVRVSEALSDQTDRNRSRIRNNEVVDATVITRKDLVIGEHATVKGSVKSAGTITVQNGATVHGNLIADGRLVLEGNVSIGGVVFTQDSLYVGPDSQIGVKGKIKSAIAKDDIILCASSRIYGYVSCERTGMTVTADEFYEMI